MNPENVSGKDRVINLISNEGKSSTSKIQRRFRWGWAHTAILLDEMASDGILSMSLADGRFKEWSLIAEPAPKPEARPVDGAEIKYSGQCQHGLPLSMECELCRLAPEQSSDVQVVDINREEFEKRLKQTSLEIVNAFRCGESAWTVNNMTLTVHRILRRNLSQQSTQQ